MKNLILFCVVVIASIGFYSAQEIFGDSRGRLLFHSNEKVGVQEEDGKEFIPALYDNIEYWEGSYEIYKCYSGESFTIRDCTTGKIMLEEYSFTSIELNYYGDSYDVTSTKGKGIVGFYNQLKIIVPPIYDEVDIVMEPFGNDGYVVIASKGLKKGIYMRDSLYLDVEYDEIYIGKNYEDYFIAKKDGKSGMIQFVDYPKYAFNTVIPFIYDGIEQLKFSKFYEREFMLEKNGKKGIAALTEYNGQAFEIVVPVIYDKINWKKYDYLYESYVFKAKLDGENVSIIYNEHAFSQYIDQYGIPYIEDLYGSLSDLREQVAVIPVKKYESLNIDREFYAVKDVNDKWGIMNIENNEYIIAPIYDGIETKNVFTDQNNYQYSIIKVLKGSKELYVIQNHDYKSSKIVISGYEFVNEDGCCPTVVVENEAGKFGVLEMYVSDSIGYSILPEYDFIKLYNNYNIIMRKGTEWSFFNLDSCPVNCGPTKTGFKIEQEAINWINEH